MPLTAMEVKVTPVEKPSNDKANPQNYRPIGQCTCIFKIFESVFVRKINEEFKKAGSFEEGQFVFTEKRSREDKLILHHNWLAKNLDNGHHVDVVYFDFSRAFDICDRRLRGLGARSWLGRALRCGQYHRS